MSGLSDIQIGSVPAMWLQAHTGLGWSSNISVSAFPFDSLDVKYQFDQLRSKWRTEYGSSSSARVITNAPSYKQIVFMGKRVLPLIFRDLDESPEPDYWFAALKEITNANPISQSDHGN